MARLAASPDLLYSLAAKARDSVAGRTWDDAVAELLDVHYPHAVRLRHVTAGQASTPS